MLYLILRIVHLVSMATWFGVGLFVPGDIRRTLAAGGDTVGLRDRVNRVSRVASAFGWLTFLSGIGLIFAMGGMGAVPVPIHIALTLTLVTLLFNTFGTGRVWKQLDTALAAGASAESVAPQVKRMAMFSGIFQTLWLVNLLLMVLRHNLM